jgi:hypothetical protein
MPSRAGSGSGPSGLAPRAISPGALALRIIRIPFSVGSTTAKCPAGVTANGPSVSMPMPTNRARKAPGGSWAGSTATRVRSARPLGNPATNRVSPQGRASSGMKPSHGHRSGPTRVSSFKVPRSIRIRLRVCRPRTRIRPWGSTATTGPRVPAPAKSAGSGARPASHRHEASTADWGAFPSRSAPGAGSTSRTPVA